MDSNPVEVKKLLDSEIAKFQSRNHKLLMADRFPGSLDILESLQDLGDLKNDPECGPFVSDAIQISLQNRGQFAFESFASASAPTEPCVDPSFLSGLPDLAVAPEWQCDKQ